MKVVVLVGGVGGARFLLGVKAALGLPAVGVPEVHGAEVHPAEVHPAEVHPAEVHPAEVHPAEVHGAEQGVAGEHEISAVVNTGDDIWLHGLRICPDLDTCMYTLGGGIDPERGWGRAAESWTVQQELARYNADPDWFGLGDRDLATHLIRSRMLRAGYPLSAVTAALCDRWQPGVQLLPATDDRCETHVVIEDADGRRAMHFQEWWVRHRAEPAASAFVPVGADDAEPAAGVLDAIAAADVVLLAPSNPVVSIGSVLAVPGIRDAIRTGPAPVVGLSPIVGGRAVRGMAETCLATIGVRSEAGAVGRHYGARGRDGILDGWLVHLGDDDTVPGVLVREVPLLMSDVHATAAMAAAALGLAGVRT